MRPFSIKNIFSVLLVLFPVIVFYLVFQKYAVNIPHWDDFAIRNTLAQLLESNSFAEKVKLLFSQHNEHRIFSTRLSAWLVYLLQGTLDLKKMMIIGIGTLIGILLLFYQVSKKYNLPRLAFVPISFILFNVGLFENTFWGMASVQNFGVILFAFLTFYWLVFSIEIQYKYYFYLALIACFMGVFTSSNGLIIPLIGIAILFVQQRKKDTFIWIAVSIFLVLGFFYDFTKNPDSVVKTDFSNWHLLAKGFLVTSGSIFDLSVIAPNKHLDITMAWGLFLMIFICLFAYQVLFKKYNLLLRTNDLFLLASLAFISITSLGIVIARISHGIDILLTSKYKIYSVLTLVIFYLVILNSISEKKKNNFIQFAIFTSILFNFYTYITAYQSIKLLHQERITDQFKQQHSDKSFPSQGIMQVLQQPEKAFYDPIINEIWQAKDSTLKTLKVISKAESYELTLPRNGKELDLSNSEAGLYFILKSKKNIYLYPSLIKASGMSAYLAREFLFNNQLKIDSFTAEISKLYIQSDKYIIGTILVENNNSKISWSNQTIDIQVIDKEKPKQNW